MGYQSRKRKYLSRRERFERDTRNFKRMALIAGIVLAVYLFMTRYSWWGYLKTYFY